MSRFKIVNLLDQLFISICIFLVVYAWINFYVRNLWTTFILSLIFSFAIIFILFYFLDKKQTKARNNKKKIDEINRYHLAYRLLPHDKKLELLKSIIEKNYVVEIKAGLISYTKSNQHHIIINATHIEKLTQNDLINLLEGIGDINADKIEIICNSYTDLKTKIYKDKVITLIDKDTLYNDYFSSADIYPDISNIDNSITKFSWKDFFVNIFSLKKSRSYFLAGFIMIFSSIILPYHVYYLIFGTTFIVFAIICKILPTLKNLRKKS